MREKPGYLIVLNTTLLLGSWVLFLFEGCAKPVRTNPSEILKEAYVTQEGLKSVKVRLKLEIKVLDSPGGNELARRSLTGEGEYERPDRSKMITKSDSSITEVITIGDTSYVRSEKENWVRKRASGFADTAVTVRNVSNLMKFTKQLTLKGMDYKAYHLTFRVDLSKLKGGFTSSDQKTPLLESAIADVDLWVDKKNFRVKRLRVKQSGESSGLPGGFVTTSVNFEFFDFNKPVSIEAPF